ncbi:FkbM family methyltransferase [Candidatus Pelagibacter sp.]|nr:FkbM family methyltransferase [Candidatus Pelagibacter sp.]MDA9631111.1 FkbM family methyltransferase [Candidatus Pelagibacter sp.]
MINEIKNKIHILHNIYFKHKYFIKKKSYSMDGEDLFIKNYFKGKKNGFYIDVGCYHPIHRNNTHLLHMQNWSGINIDTSQFSIDIFKYMRPKDLNYHCAISDKNENIKLFYQKELSQLSTTEEEQAKKVFQGSINEKKIKAFTLDEILSRDKYEDSKIDFLDIDVEGADLKAIKGLSFDKFQPELVCIEIHEKEVKQSKIYKFLFDKKYELIWSGIFSHIFKRL